MGESIPFLISFCYLCNIERSDMASTCKYPIGIQTFEKIREDGYVYVDKTALIYEIAHNGTYYFLSRPRRFGKSLLVSTLEAYFKGRKELFAGLAIEKLEKDWKEYPVLRVDFSGKSYDQADVLGKVLNDILNKWEREYGCKNDSDVPGLRFSNVIQSAYEKTGKPVVILIDEYDKPIVDNLTNEDLADTFRSQLQGFYSVMKAQDQYIRFGFLTGVTKMGKMSVFSGLNNLTDISMDLSYATLCGVTEEELKAYFGSGISAMAENNSMSIRDCYERLAYMYDGYHFHPKAAGVYNPFSLLNALRAGEFRKYWFATGTPGFLIKYLTKSPILLDDLSQIRASEQTLGGVGSSRPQVITLLYQSGYLTIKGYDPKTERYTLGYPNKEVESGFLESLSEYFAPSAQLESPLSVDKFVNDIRSGNVEMLMRRFTAFFADMDYQIQGRAELYFQNTMYVMLKLMGQLVQVERHTSNGRIDVLIQTDKYVYILELKRDQDPTDALDQIDEKGYDWPFMADNRKVFKIGATFSSATKRLENWVVA